MLDVYEVGESEQGLFLSMRLVTGQTLLDLLRDGELDAERALKLLDQVTGALDAAHEAELDPPRRQAAERPGRTRAITPSSPTSA